MTDRLRRVPRAGEGRPGDARLQGLLRIAGGPGEPPLFARVFVDDGSRPAFARGRGVSVEHLGQPGPTHRRALRRGSPSS